MDYLNMVSNITQILGFILTIAGFEYIRRFLSKSSSKIPKPGLWLFYIAATILFVANLLQAWGVWFYPDQHAANIDLQSYCISLGYKSNSFNTFCMYPLETAPLNKKDISLNLNDACSEQYRELGQTFHLANPSDPTSGFCEDSFGNQEKGLDVNTYCNNHLQGGKSEAVYTGNSWACRLQINMQIACVWMYGTTNILARETDTTWSCYTQPRLF